MEICARRPAVGVAALLVLMTACAGERSDGKPGPTPTSSSATATPPFAPTTTPVDLAAGPRLADLPRHRRPRVGYVDDGDHVSTDGRRTPLPDRFGISSFARFDGGFLVADARFFEGTNGLLRVTPTRHEAIGPCTGGGGAVSGDRSHSAWVVFGCPESTDGPDGITLYRDSGTERREQVIVTEPDTNQVTFVVGLSGEEVVYTRAFGTAGSFITDLASAPRRIPWIGGASAAGSTNGLVAGGLQKNPNTAGVVDLTTGRLLWRAPRVSPRGFSPDGSLLLVVGPRSWEVLDARTGEARATLFSGLRTREVVWEDRRHLLTVARQGGKQAIVRSGLDGRLSLAGDVVPRDRPGEQRFVLESTP